MIRFLFLFLLLVHGLIHLMGFVKGFKLAEVSQLTLPISKPAGALWLLAALLFLLTSALFLLKYPGWWMTAVPALLLSQVLIFGSWQDARFGTIANVLALIGIVIGYGAWSFNRLAQQEQQHLLSQSFPTPTTITGDQIATLPPVVQKWLHRSGVAGKEAIQVVHLKQGGAMMTSPGGKWMPFQATQYFTIAQPGFVWQAEVQAGFSLFLTGLDKYEAGHGHMLIKLLGLLPVVDAKGPAIDQGTMLRYLGETCWFPSAALSDYLRWEVVDSLTAKATMTYGGITAFGTYFFNETGDLTGFEAKRYYDRKEGATLEDWHIAILDWRTFSGVRVPASMEVTWKLKTGDFTWLKLEITDVAFNEAALPKG